MHGEQSKVKLSKGILEMKFMKRSKERVEKEEENTEGQLMYCNEITEQMKRGGKHVTAEVGINACMDLFPGRTSYGGINPNVERIVNEIKAKKRDKIEKEKEKDVTDVEMAKKLSENMSKKERSKKRFLKPVD